MDPEVTGNAEADTEADAAEEQAVAEAMKGYAGKRDLSRAITAPEHVEPPAATPAPAAEPPEKQTSADANAPAPAAVSPAASPAPEPPKIDPAVENLQQQLAALRAEVSNVAQARGTSDAEVRRLNGEIGNLNRTIQQLQQLSKGSPLGDELSADLQRALALAEEFPETFGPMGRVLKALTARLAPPATAPAAAPAATPAPQAAPAVAATPAPTAAPVAAPATHAASVAPKPAPGPTAEQLRDMARRDALRDAVDSALDRHQLDRIKLNADPHFQAWFAAKPKEEQVKLKASMDVIEVVDLYRDYDKFRKTKQVKRDAVDAAVTPQGTGAAPVSTPSEEDEEAAALEGYNAAKRKRLY